PGADITIGNLLLDSVGVGGGAPSTLSMNRQVTVNGMTWQTGLVTGSSSSRLTLAAGGAMTMTTDLPGQRKELKTITLLAFGTIRWQDGEFKMSDRANLIIDAGGKFSLETDE